VNGDLLIASPAEMKAPPPPCTLDNPNQARCPAGSISEIRGAFLGGDDSLTTAANVTVPIHASGGNGNDTLTGGAKGDYLRGDGGDDTLSGRGGADSLWGGAGKDSCSGGAGQHDLASGCETVKGVP
jgi:Ca2+-binding RTX toxin-like protein